MPFNTPLNEKVFGEKAVKTPLKVTPEEKAYLEQSAEMAARKFFDQNSNSKGALFCMMVGENLSRIAQGQLNDQQS